MLKLKFGFSNNPRVEPLVDGTVKPKDIDLDITLINPGDLFYRNLKNEEFDVSEMSISSFSMVVHIFFSNVVFFVSFIDFLTN